MSLSAFCYAAGYGTGALGFLWMARRRRLLTDGVLTLMVVGLVAGLVCAGGAQRLFGGSPGKTVLGGVAGGYIAVAIGKRVIGLRRPLGDLFAVALSAGEAVGRWGCYFGGCCYGKPCRLPWAVWQHNAYRHPTQIYLSLANVGILAAIWGFSRTRPPENGLFYLQGLLYCTARFSIELLRETSSPAALNWTLSACAAGALFFGAKLYLLLKPMAPAVENGRE